MWAPAVFVTCYKSQLQCWQLTRAASAADGMSPGKVGFGLDTTTVPPSLSRSDDAFLGDGVEFMWGDHDIDITQLNDLFDKVSSLFSVSGKWAGHASVCSAAGVCICILLCTCLALRRSAPARCTVYAGLGARPMLSIQSAAWWPDWVRPVSQL